MELVGADEVLGLLRDRCRPPPGGTSSGETGVSRTARSTLPLGLASRGGAATHSTSRRTSVFGTLRVDAVHRDVVAGEGRPAEGDLREISRAHHDPGLLVREVHEDLGALARLEVLEGVALPVLRVEADVPDVLLAGGPDVDLPQLRPRRGGEPPRALRGCGAVVPKPGIVTARMPARGRPRRSKVRTQTRRASVESRPPERPRTTRFTPTCSIRRARPAVWIENTSRHRSSRVAGSAGTKGCGSIARTRRWGCGAGTGREGHRPVGRGVVVDRVGERGLPRALDAQALHVDVGHDQLAVPPEALPLGEQHAVLGDQQVAAEDEVGRGLVDARVGVDVGGERAARLLAHQLAAVLGLGHEVVRGRGVQEDGGARDRVARAGRDRGPEVLADLDGEGHPGVLRQLEQEVRAEGNGLAGEAHLGLARLARGREPPLLVVLLVPGEEGLRHDPEDPARLQHRRRVEESAALRAPAGRRPRPWSDGPSRAGPARGPARRRRPGWSG